MTGKEKCKLLKQIRKDIADRNGIAFEPAECHYFGECAGTCPKCDEEIRYLDAQINKKVELGGKVHIAGVKLDNVKVQNRTYISPSIPERNGWNDGTNRPHVFRTPGLIIPMPSEDDDYGDFE